MNSSFIHSSLVIAICWLSASVNGDCCTSSLDLTFKVKDASCGAVGGHGSDRCSITICANGAGLVGTWCGQGPCNPFGCNCDDGCLKGDWSKSFLERNKEHTIEILEEKWSTVDLSTVIKAIPIPALNFNIG
ncbi:protein Diedel-like [Drosophila serrata]|uniref:protein Diedel-like n=1 Tax=Drosophila serrata TaxID=7274 RepID=UPI000A1D028B|nr:protein Diedel-like [Drosophila serrata]